jgi:hypothetical protein
VLHGELPAGRDALREPRPGAARDLGGVEAAFDVRSAMTSIDIQMNGDGCWPDLHEKHAAGKVIWDARLGGVSLLPDGDAIDGFTGEAKKLPILTLRIELPDGTSALAQVKLEMLSTIVGAMKSRMDYLAELKAKGGVDS